MNTRPHRRLNQGPPYDVVLLDCDSTLCSIEGLDQLAIRAGLAEQLIPITTAAMEGRLPFDRAYAERLDLLQPDAAAVEWLSAQYLAHIMAGAETLVSRLHQCGKTVHIISGGIRQALLPLGAALGIPDHRVHGVTLIFDGQGRYAGYDADSPLARQHGKAVVCRQILRPDDRAVLIGDGVTDLEAREAGPDFIGFGGIVRRAVIEEKAAVYYPHPELTGLLRWLLSPAEANNKYSI